MSASDLTLDDFSLSRGGSISGRATLGGQPVAQAQVDVAARGSRNIQTRYTGPDGYFTVSGLPEEGVRLIVSDGTGHVGVYVVPPGSTEPAEVKLGPAARIEVALRGPRDALTNAEIFIVKIDDYPHSAWARVDGTGHATFFAPSGSVTVRAATERLEGEVVVEARAAETVSVSIELKPKKTPPTKD